ncbi:hypothetical protein ACFX2G_033149 [Malus domestica]
MMPDRSQEFSFEKRKMVKPRWDSAIKILIILLNLHRALASVIRSSEATTMMELEIELKKASESLKVSLLQWFCVCVLDILITGIFLHEVKCDGVDEEHSPLQGINSWKINEERKALLLKTPRIIRMLKLANPMPL